MEITGWKFQCDSVDCKSTVELSDRFDVASPKKALELRGWATSEVDGVVKHYCQAHKPDLAK